MKVLFAIGELAPLAKVGGLGDVGGALPKALKKLNLDVRVILPKYEEIDDTKFTSKKARYDLKVSYKGGFEPVGVYETVIPGSDVAVFLLHNEKYLSKGPMHFNGGAYNDSINERDRFAFFSKTVAQFSSICAVTQECWIPDVIHCHDWHTGFVTPLLKIAGIDKPSLFTIHNIAYQGSWGLDALSALEVDKSRLKAIEWDAADDNITMLLQGIINSDLVSTVSPAYAKEIMTSRFGEGLQDVLKGKEGRVFGILNGIDYSIWDPAADAFLDRKYSISDYREGKMANKKALMDELGFDPDYESPLLGFVARLTDQKGIDLLIPICSDLVEEGFHIVILGMGEKDLEDKLSQASKRLGLSSHFKAVIKFDEELAHKIYAASDFFLVPSRFEPCGLTQMIAMKYGSLPIVHEVGGLKDTVKNELNGFTFKEFSSKIFLETLKRAYQVYKKEDEMEKIIKKAMNEDFSWENSAGKYLELYERSVELHG